MATRIDITIIRKNKKITEKNISIAKAVHLICKYEPRFDEYTINNYVTKTQYIMNDGGFWAIPGDGKVQFLLTYRF